jgi:putative CocE/NonD family hydrolase
MDEFVYDPANPVFTLGGQVSTLHGSRGPMDRRVAQERSDVLVYTSPPLTEDLEVTGPVTVKLFAASSAPNTDFTATLSDVHPDGKAIHICEGIRGVTFRKSLEHPTLIKPGRIYEYTIDLWETSMVFKAGHRLRVDISSSNFPRFARNQNITAPFGTSAEMRKATQTIYHDARHPAHILLPVIPRENKQ